MIKNAMLQAFDASYFRGKRHFEDYVTENDLMFQSIYRYFKRNADSDHI